MNARALAVVCALASAFVAESARANGRAPATSTVTLRPDSEDRLLVGTTFGAVISFDHGAHWKWICEQSTGYGGTVDPTFLWRPNGKIYAVTFFGLAISQDEGCNFASHPFFANRTPSDIVAHPTLADTIFVTTGRNGSMNGLYRSDDAGASFVPTGLERADLHFTTVRISPSDPMRIYVAGARDMPFQAYILRSDDGGATWTDIPQNIPELSFLDLLAVNPVNPDVLFVYLAATPSAVLRSTDGGETFQEVLLPGETVRSAEISDDGQTVWVATTSHIYRSTDGGDTFARLPAFNGNACLARRGSDLFACGSAATSGFALGVSHDGGDTWQTLYNLADVDGVLECQSPSTTRAQCVPRWSQLQTTLSGLGPDGGTADGGTADGGAADGGAADGGPAPAGAKRCGCTAAGDAGPGLLLVALAAAFLRRRRSRCASLAAGPTIDMNES
jgi:MYXO-CTERM domain-containing protein